MSPSCPNVDATQTKPQAEYVRIPFADGTLFAWPEGVHPEEALLLGDVLPTGYFCARQAHDIVGSDGVCVVCRCCGLF